ncbi:L-rhamnose 1-dehydrogenase (NADP(+)) [uncultured archaeon]|nr:L-rhamnose 1-dehydrogenase (NADP(+)) [uncultured archaeon]
MSKQILKGKVALVTGSAKRTGRAIALALADAGADVVVHYNTSSKEATEVVRLIRKKGRKSVALRADLRSPQEVAALFSGIEKEFGGVDVLVNNVGTYMKKHVADITADEWDSLLDGTLNATYYCCCAALPYMRRRKWGRIINMADASVDQIKPFVYSTPYKIGKMGIVVLTKTLAVSEGRYGVTVNAVSPGVLFNSVVKPGKDIPLGRMAKYEDIINAIMFLIDPASEYITGVNLKVSGGFDV